MADATTNPPHTDGDNGEVPPPALSQQSTPTDGRSISISRDGDGSFGIKVSGSRAGIRVKTVSPSSSAAQQKLLRGDILTQIDGVELDGKRSKEVTKMISGSTEGSMDLVIGEPVPRSKSGAHKVFAVIHKATKGAKKMIRRKMGKTGGSSDIEGARESKSNNDAIDGDKENDEQDSTTTAAEDRTETSTEAGTETSIETGTENGVMVDPPVVPVVTVVEEDDSTTAGDTDNKIGGELDTAPTAELTAINGEDTAISTDADGSATATVTGDDSGVSSDAPPTSALRNSSGDMPLKIIDAAKRLSKTMQLDEFERGESCTDYRKTRRKKGDDFGGTADEATDAAGNTSTLSTAVHTTTSDAAGADTPATGTVSVHDASTASGAISPDNGTTGGPVHGTTEAGDAAPAESPEGGVFVLAPKLVAAATMRIVKPTTVAASQEAGGNADVGSAPSPVDERSTTSAPADVPIENTVVVLEDPKEDPLAPPSPGPQPTDATGICQDFSMNSQHGTRHGELNQDSCYGTTVRVRSAGVAGEDESEIVVCAAFDGHGLLGERAAVAAAAELETLCNDHAVLEGFAPGNDASAAMVDLFARLHDRVCAEHQRIPRNYSYPGRPGSDTTEFKLKKYEQEPGSPDGSGSETRKSGLTYRYSSEHMPPAPIDFGCTAAVAVVTGTQAVVGSLGDAGAVVCRCDSDGEPMGELISATHTAKDDAEIKRIERDFPGKAYFTPDGYLAPLDDDLGQYEVQLTRSFGHALLKDFGITAEPHVHTFDVKETNTFALVLCSDGVTDELQPRDIAERVAQEDSPAASAKMLCQDAQDFCMETEKIDDCTAVVLRFKTD